MELFDGDYGSSGQTYRKAKRFQQQADEFGSAVLERRPAAAAVLIRRWVKC